MTISRRNFLLTAISAAAAAAVFDPDLALWVPGAKTFMDTRIVVPMFNVGDLVWIPSGAPLEHVAAVVGRPMGRLASISQMAYFNTSGLAQLAKMDSHGQRLAGVYMGRSGGLSIIQTAGPARVRIS